MLKLQAEQVSKKFLRRHVFKNFNYAFEQGQSYAVTGANGSGKSTLLQVLSGYMMPSGGKIILTVDGNVIDEEQHFKYGSFASPFQELIEEFTVAEAIGFHAKLRKMIYDDPVVVAREFQLEAELHKPLRYLSSGNKQRVKLALAFCTDAPVLFLDEPTQNLDQRGVDLYLQAIEQHTSGRLVMVSSNDEREYRFCNHRIPIESYK